MHSSLFFFSSLLPLFASAHALDFLDHSVAQLPLVAPSRLAQIPRPSKIRPSESVLVHLVDPASPTVSTIVTPASIAREALEITREGEQEEEEQESSPNFGSSCEFEGSFTVCGDYFERSSGTDHGLFCSPKGVCAGKGSVCGSDSACGNGLSCDLSAHRCVVSSTLMASASASRRNSRQKTAVQTCPQGSQACSSTFGGIECIFTELEVTQCGSCLETGGKDCSKIENALATSCRKGLCLVHACMQGFTPSQDESECIDELL